jgi:hypothetical protein
MTDMNDSASKSVGLSRIQTAVFKDAEMLGGGLLLTAVLIIGLITASDYGLTTDEFIFDAYGPKALAWYSSWFTNRSLFEYRDTYLYGPALGPPIFVVARGSVVFDGLRHLIFILPMLALLAAWALLQMAPLLLRMPTYAAGLVALHLITTVSIMVYLHPLEYIAVNAFAGGPVGAYGRFDLDYWSAAATEAVRRLEERLARHPPVEFAMRQPRVMVCIGFRESMVEPIFSQPWIVTTEPTEADFVIVTERSKCARNVQGIIIDRVERFGRIFAATIEMPRHESRAGQPLE